MRGGDFSELNRIVYDPLNPGTPFAGNLVPVTRQDPASRNIISQIHPAPHTRGQFGRNAHLFGQGRADYRVD